MGTIFYQGRMPNTKAVLGAIKEYFGGEIVAHNRVGNKLYIAVADAVSTDGYVVLLQQEKTRWGFQTLCEGWNPYHYEASAKVLDKLTDNPHIGAQTWRAECRRRLSLLNVTAGALLTFEPPILAEDGVALDCATVVETDTLNGKTTIFVQPVNGFETNKIYQMSGNWWKHATIAKEGF